MKRYRRLVPLMLIAVMMAVSVPFALAKEELGNLPPIAENLEFTTYKNIAIEGTLAAIDPEGGVLLYRLVEKPARGSLTLAEDGSGCFVYEPYENKTGKDSFTYAAVDETGNTSATATVKIRIEKNKAKMTYADMSGDAAHYAALCLAAEGVFKGESLGGEYFFRPDEPVTRSEFIAMAMQMAGERVVEGVTRTGFYDDEAIETWAKPYVATALRNGTVRGIINDAGQAVFRGESEISYAEASVLLNRMLGITDVANVSVPTLADTNASSVWAYQAAMNLASVKVLNVENIKLSDTLTRAEAAQLLVAAMELK